MATPKRSSRRSGSRRAGLRRPRTPPRAGRRGGQRGRSQAAERPRPLASGPDSVDPRLLEGLALYNHHRFFECHEVLERLWLSLSATGVGGGERDFYKGLIQAAVAFHHWSRGNLGGAMSLYRSSSRYLRRYRPAFLDVDVEGFLRRYTELFRWLRRHPMRYEARVVPAIHMRGRPASGGMSPGP